MSIEEKVKQIIVEQLGLEAAELLPSTTFKELGADSLDLAEVVIVLERTFKIRISPESASQLRSVGSAIDYVHHHAAAAGDVP